MSIYVSNYGIYLRQLDLEIQQAMTTKVTFCDFPPGIEGKNRQIS